METVFYFILALLIGALLFFVVKNKKTRKFGLYTLAAVLIFEIFICNFNSFHLIGGDYPGGTLNMGDATTLTGLEQKGTSYALTPNSTNKILWKNLDRRVGTLTVSMQISGAATVHADIDMNDDTNESYRYGVAQADILPGDHRSSVIVCRFSGNVHDLRLNIEVPEGATVTLLGVYINEPVPPHFSVFRLLLAFFGVFGLYLLITHEALCEENEKRWELVRAVCVCMTLVFVFTATAMVVGYDLTHGSGSDWDLTAGDEGQINQMTHELVDAFEAGQVSLLYTPSDKLLALKNPYDWSARSNAGLHSTSWPSNLLSSKGEDYYLWDHCLYNGKYYSYYGIAPVILLFLPYHAITGHYFPSAPAVWLFGVAGMVFLSMLYLCFIRKFFPHIPGKLVIAGLAVMQLSSGIWYCFCSTLFYEIAQSAGFAFTVAGAYFLLSANLIGRGKVSRARVAIGTTCLGLAVLSRPTTAVYCVVSLVFLWFGLSRVREENAKGIGFWRSLIKKPVVTYLLCALVPFVILGGAQMIYNYARFDSFFDFGIQYSLTINDFTQSEYHTRFVSIGLYNYLLAAPVMGTHFPYVTSAFDNLQPNGYYFVANRYAVGLIWRAMPVVAWIFGFKALRTMEKQTRRRALWYTVPLCLAAPAVVLISIWESGYGARYCIDFGWEMLIGAYAIFFYLYGRIKERGFARFLSSLFILTVIPALLFNFALTWQFYTSSVNTLQAEKAYVVFARLFDFWL